MGKKDKLYIIAGYLGIIIFTVIAILISGSSYTVYLNNPYNSDKATVISSNESVVINSGISRSGDYTRFVFKAINEGKATVTATIYNEANEKESISVHYEFSVLPTGVFYLTGYDYGGWQFTLIGMALMMLYSFSICFVQFERRKKIQFFSYKTVLDSSLIVFFGLQSLMYLGLLGVCLILPQRVDSWQIYNLAGFITMLIFFISIPFIVLFAGFLSVSNLSLIKHEGFRKKQSVRHSNQYCSFCRLDIMCVCGNSQPVFDEYGINIYQRCHYPYCCFLGVRIYGVLAAFGNVLHAVCCKT